MKNYIWYPDIFFLRVFLLDLMAYLTALLILKKRFQPGICMLIADGICFCRNGIVLDDASLSAVSHTDAFGRKFCEYHLFASGKEVESVGKRVSGYFCAPVGLRGIAEFLVWIISASAGQLDLVCRYGDVVCVSMHIWMEKEKRTGSFFPGRAGI